MSASSSCTGTAENVLGAGNQVTITVAAGRFTKDADGTVLDVHDYLSEGQTQHSDNSVKEIVTQRQRF